MLRPLWQFNRSVFPQYPANMPAVWTEHFLEPVRAVGGTVVVGEWGGRYTDLEKDDDELWQDAFKAFLLESRCTRELGSGCNPPWARPR